MVGSKAPERLVTPRLIFLITGSLCFFVASGMTIPILSRFVKSDLHDGNLAVGIVIGIQAVGSIGIRPFITPRLMTWGCQRMGVISLFVGAASFFGYGFAQNTVELCLLRLLTGAAQASLLVAGTIDVTNRSPASRRGQAVSYFSVAPYLGNGIGPFLGLLIFDHSGYTTTFVSAGVMSLLGLGPLLAVSNDRIARVAGAPKQRLIHRTALWPGTVLAFGVIAITAMSAFLPLFVIQLGGSGGTAYLFLTFAGVVLFMRLVGGRLPDRLGSSRAATIATAANFLSMVGFAATPNTAFLFVALVPLGIGAALQYPALMTLVISRVPDSERIEVVATYTMFLNIATGVGGLFVGGAAAIGGYRFGFGACAAGALVSLVLLRTIVLRRGDGGPVPKPARAGGRHTQHHPQLASAMPDAVVTDISDADD